jgi:hypothetical protein
MTLWPTRNRAMPFGVTWVKEDEHSGGNRWGGDRPVKASSGELKDSVDLFPRDIELLNDFVYGGSGFKVLEHGGHGHPGILKYPCPAQSARHAFHDGALGPINRCHALTPFYRSLYHGSAAAATRRGERGFQAHTENLGPIPRNCDICEFGPFSRSTLYRDPPESLGLSKSYERRFRFAPDSVALQAVSEFTLFESGKLELPTHGT